MSGQDVRWLNVVAMTVCAFSCGLNAADGRATMAIVLALFVGLNAPFIGRPVR